MLPDIQSTKGDGEGESLSWVGMEQIDLPIDIAEAEHLLPTVQ